MIRINALSAMVLLYVLVMAMIPAPAAPPMQIIWLHERGLAPEMGTKNRVLAGKNLQAMLFLPGARKPGGVLLDPESVSFTLDGAPLESFVYYKKPEVALVFARVDAARIESGEFLLLRLSANSTEAGDDATSTSLSLVFTDDECTSATLAARRANGRPIQIVDAAGAPVTDARLFGQRREDLWAVADRMGRVYLDEYLRGTPGPHYAWSTDHWTTAFDPPASPTVVLRPRDANTKRMVDFHVTDQAGRPIAPVVLCMDTVRHQTIRTTEGTLIEARSAGATEVLVMAAGFAAARTEIPPDATRWDVALEPIVQPE